MDGGGKTILDIDKEEKTGKSDYCPEGNECPHGSSEFLQFWI